METKHVEIDEKIIRTLAWYFLHDLISLFAVHPLWNIDAIKQYASLRTIDYRVKQPTNRIFNEKIRKLQKLSFVEHFRISAGRNTHYRGNAIFPTDTVLETGYCVYSKLNSVTIGFDSKTSRTHIVDNNGDEIIQLGLDLMHLKKFVPLMKALSKLEGSWFNLKEINSHLGTTFSIQNLSRHVSKLSEYYEEYQFKHILEIDRGRTTKFRLLHTEWLIKPTILKPKILTSSIPVIMSPSSKLPSREELEKIGLGIRWITE